MTTNNLTEQWKKGELEQGIYYIKTKDGIENDGFDGKEFGFFSDMEIDQILGKVPSYEEWQEIKEQNNALKMMVDYWSTGEEMLTIDNNKLKELLKECREVVEFTKTIVNKHTWFDKILIKINGALK